MGARRRHGPHPQRGGAGSDGDLAGVTTVAGAAAALRTGAFALAAAAAVVVTAVGTAAGLAAGKASVGFPALVEQGVPLLGIALFSFGIGLVAAQLTTTRRGAVTLGGLVMLALYSLDALARVNKGLVAWAVISPFHLVDDTTAIVPGGHFDGAGASALYVIAAALVALSALGFRRRDLQAALFRRRAAERQVVRSASANSMLRLPVLRRLWQQRVGLAGWAVGTVVGAALLVSIARGSGKLLTSAPGFNRPRRRHGPTAATAVVGSVWLGVAALIVAAYAIARRRTGLATTPAEGWRQRSPSRSRAGTWSPSAPSRSVWRRWWCAAGIPLVTAVAPARACICRRDAW